MYETYESQSRNTSVDKARHCLSCDKYGHTAINCPRPNTAMIVANYGIWKDLLSYSKLTLDATAVSCSPASLEEPFDQPDVSWPNFPTYGNFMEETYEDPPLHRRDKKRKAAVSKYNESITTSVTNKDTEEIVVGNN